MQMNSDLSTKETNPAELYAERYKQGIDETDRRREVAQGGIKESTEESTLSFLPFKGTDQAWALVNLAHRFQRPNATRPAIQIIGLFATREECVEHVNYASALYSDASYWVWPTHEFRTICSKTENQMNTTYVETKVQKVLNLYKEEKQEHDEEFQSNVTTHQTGNQGGTFWSKDAKRAENQGISSRISLLNERLNDKLKNGGKKVQSYPRSLERRNQNFAVIARLRDRESGTSTGKKDPEPLICIYRCFDSMKEAKEWQIQVAASHLQAYDTYIVEMYQWLFPEDLKLDEITEEYRHGEQNRIMKQRKQEKQKVTNFEQWCKQTGTDIPAMRVTDEQPYSVSSLTDATPIPNAMNVEELVNQPKEVTPMTTIPQS